MNGGTAPAGMPVLFEERPAGGGKRIGIATLNAPGTLNGLSLAMSHLLDDRLRAWSDDDGIALVILQGAGDKAFCAGGDLHGLYRGMRDYEASGSTDVRSNGYASEFFQVEYRLDYRIHTYRKPILCWGHGIVMGGGIGLMAGASHRVVSERSKLAFPEIGIGLFPDVGGSWLLQRVADRGGVFLALTGAPLAAGDAIHAGLADHFVAEAQRAAVHAALAAAEWSDDAGENRERLTGVLRQHAGSAGPGPLQRHRGLIAGLCAADRTLDEIVASILAIGDEDPWLANARQALAAGSPGSARLGFELQRRASALSLADVFRMEYIAALHCAAHGDFAEGIRALLIDKDRQPRWNPATLAEATPAWSETFFQAPWPAGDAHPLADLGSGPSPNGRTYA
ncbi:enoyl-CoA hydratase/isomerase family protein [Stenotrophomonas sp. MMGLT7]|uniref:enoyl-CoA hydratase/isomerase family protein n=1 Tax=Stenotrophomonas sp. MMGLT7 TaxID=2901227 RepID=UPI001E5E84B5|nr:enoyl-CoA hydratase/isomerase family protein [Stenotrophomonas sp. MMGLT7]MCD7096892.1 enoyl-CoA hydratase/isomerase family protein [Stenotrophomonas sp. MMGLT7]